MPLGSVLTDFQKGMIETMYQNGASQVEIAKNVGCSQGTVSNYLNQKTHKPEKLKMGPAKILTPRDERQIAKLASTGQYSIREIQRELPHEVSKSTIHRALTENPNLQYKKKLTQPPLTPAHKEARLNFAKDHMTWDKEWRKVVFSDEKKFNLDGPDGYAHYWHDLRKEEKIFSKRQAGGGSVMLWGGFGYNGKTELATVPPRMKSEGYQHVLQSNLLRESPKIGGRGWIFQQDNASVHSSRSTRDFLEQKKVRLLDWPSKSPDLNPMENLWADLSRRVYSHGRQYNTREELLRAIHDAWDEIPLERTQNLIESMKNRIFQVILRQGGYTGY